MLKTTLTALSLSLITAAAFAGTPVSSGKQAVEPAPPPPPPISYSNFSLGYSYMEADVLGLDASAHGVQAAVEFSPVEHLYFALRGSWHDVDLDVSPIIGAGDLDFDYWNVSLGVGGYIPITNNIHFVTEVGANYADISLNGVTGVDANDWGVYVTPHFRAKWGIVETHLGVSYTSNELAPTEWNGFARLLVEVAPQLDVYVAGTVGFAGSDDAFDDVWGIQAGIRFKF